MFSRICGIPSTCVRCRPWLAGRPRPSEYPNVTTASLPLCRWRSVLTQNTNIDEDEPQPRIDNHDEIQEPQHESSARKSETLSFDSQDSLIRPIYRRQRSHKAEKLGVNVLGKPAEVLILPSRKRKQAKLAPERSDNEGTGGLQETLDSELKPVTMREVLKNIDLFKKDLGRDKQIFSGTEWENIRSRLSGGFTKVQLQEYLRVALGLNESDPGEAYLSAHREKRNIAAEIMTSVWKWKRAELRDEPLVTDFQKGLLVKESKLAFIMLHEKQRLRNLSATLDVRIDVFRNKRRIELTGAASAVEDAMIEVNKLIESVQETTLPIPKALQKRLTNKSKSESLLAMLMQKHKLLITKSSGALTIVSSMAASGDIVLRDLLVYCGRFYKTTPFSFYLDQHQQQATKAPFHLVDPPQWLQQDSRWYRHVTTLSNVTTTKKFELVEKRRVRRFTEKISRSDKMDRLISSRFVVVAGSLKNEHIVDLGQALFNFNALENRAQSSTEKSNAAPAFFLQQALLPQVLGRKEFKPVNTVTARQYSGEANSYPFLLRIRLQPLVQDIATPPLEVYLSGQDPSLGLRQQLQIRGVLAIVDQWEHILLLPNQPLDILMKRQTTIDLFNTVNQKSLPAYLAILKQIGSHLEEAQVSNRLELPPIWRLDLSTLRRSKSEAAPVEYAPEPPEYLDVTSYTSDATGERYIDHLICSTDPADSPQQRQVLQIKTSPLSALLSSNSPDPLSVRGRYFSKQKWLRFSVEAAYDLAMKFGEAENSVRKSNLAGEAAGPV